MYDRPPITAIAVVINSVTPNTLVNVTAIAAPGVGAALRIINISYHLLTSGTSPSLHRFIIYDPTTPVYVGVDGLSIPNDMGDSLRIEEPGVQLGRNTVLRIESYCSVASQVSVFIIHYYIDVVT